MKRACLECKESIKGRVDKKFCCDNCRNSYNNKLKPSASNYFRSVNSILRRNCKILSELIPDKTAKASRKKLLLKGFNFEYHTNILTTKRGDCYTFCYEYGYLLLDEDHCLLVKREDDRNTNNQL